MKRLYPVILCILISGMPSGAQPQHACPFPVGLIPDTADFFGFVDAPRLLAIPAFAGCRERLIATWRRPGMPEDEPFLYIAAAQDTNAATVFLTRREPVTADAHTIRTHRDTKILVFGETAAARIGSWTVHGPPAVLLPVIDAAAGIGRLNDGRAARLQAILAGSGGLYGFAYLPGAKEIARLQSLSNDSLGPFLTGFRRASGALDYSDGLLLFSITAESSETGVRLAAAALEKARPGLQALLGPAARRAGVTDRKAIENIANSFTVCAGPNQLRVAGALQAGVAARFLEHPPADTAGTNRH